MKYKIFFIILLVAFLLPYNFILADAPPPPPFTIYFSYDGHKISDEIFYSTLLECKKPGEESSLQGRWRSSDFTEQLNESEKQNSPEYIALSKLNEVSQADKDCTWKPFYLPFSVGCYNSLCRFDYILGNFKTAVYSPNLDKTFVSSNSVLRSYKGYYGRNTAIYYEMDIAKDGSSNLYETVKRLDYVPDEFGATTSPIEPGIPDRNFGTGDFDLMMISSLLITIIIELTIVLIFCLIKKIPKKILIGVFLGNIISIPLLWILVTSFYSTLLPAEVAVIIFEAWLMKYFSKNTLSWKTSLLLSFVINIASIIFGPIIYEPY